MAPPPEVPSTNSTAIGPGRLAVVLSTGGVGGIAHLGVLSRLVEAGIAIDVLVGASAGALVAAYYAALGDPLPVLIEDAARTSLGQLLAFALYLRALPVPGEETRQHCRRLHDRLAALDEVTFDRLRGPVPRLGILAFDWRRCGGLFAGTGDETTGTLSVGRVVRGSASIPIVFPPVIVRHGATTHLLSDGGLVRSLPLEWALAEPLAATHALGVQLPTLRRRVDALLPARRRFLAANRDRLLVVTPRVALGRNVFKGRRGLEAVYDAGRAAIDDGVLATLCRWRERPPGRGV